MRRAAAAALVCLAFGVPALADLPGGIRTETFGGVEIRYVLAPPGSAEARVLTARDLGAAGFEGLFLSDFAKMSGADAVLSGGYLQSFQPVVPLGLTRTQGRDRGPLHDSWLTDSLFCADGGGWRIGPAVAGAELSGDCLQAGPALVEEGADAYAGDPALPEAEAALLLSEQASPFLCIRGDGALAMGLSLTGTVRELSAVLAGAFGCREAMRLSGSVTAGLWESGAGIEGFNELRLANVVALYGR